MRKRNPTKQYVSAEQTCMDLRNNNSNPILRYVYDPSSEFMLKQVKDMFYVLHPRKTIHTLSVVTDDFMPMYKAISHKMEGGVQYEVSACVGYDGITVFDEKVVQPSNFMYN